MSDQNTADNYILTFSYGRFTPTDIYFDFITIILILNFEKQIKNILLGWLFSGTIFTGSTWLVSPPDTGCYLTNKFHNESLWVRNLYDTLAKFFCLQKFLMEIYKYTHVGAHRSVWIEKERKYKNIRFTLNNVFLLTTGRGNE